MGKMTVAAAAAALVWAASPQGASAACSNATLSGPFATSFSGFVSGNVPLAASAQLRFDGGGGITGSLTQSNGGVVSRGLSVTGSYSVSSDCTGFATINPSNGGHVNFDFAIQKKGRGFAGVQTNRSSIVTVTATRGAQ
jgi:hypothetical protein